MKQKELVMSTQTNTEATDCVRFYFHAITEWELSLTGCRTCWNDVVFMLSCTSTPAEILAAPHECTAPWNCAEILAQELMDHPEKW